MTIPFWHVDAFASSAFGGNPAGVCLLDRWLQPALMQRIAAENNMPETAFVMLAGSACELRWFTPTVEMDLCGHATLAAGHVLFYHRGWRGSSVVFSSPSGPLTVERRNDLLVLDFPSRPALPCEPSTVLLSGLKKEPVEIHGARDYLVVYASEEDVRGLAPDMGLLSRIDRMGVIVTAPARGARSAEDVSAESAGRIGADFVSRFFAPGVGIPEDPVTGSAHCTLIPYWARRLGKKSLRALQVSARGGELVCEDAGDRVKIGGRAATYLAGEISV
jgi:PhzF family phenazine biosynthesis protein